MVVVEAVELPMVCTCDEERRTRADDLRREVISRLSHGSKALVVRTVTMDNFLTGIIQSLNWDYDAHLLSIETDQWSAVTVEKYDGSLSLRVQCDRVEDGIAAAWKALADGPA